MAVNGLTGDDLAYIRDVVFRKAAIVIDESKDYLIETRLEKLAHDLNHPNIGALVGAIRRSPQTLTHQLVEALTTHETLFFRDVRPFEALKKEILPGLIAARQGTRQLTIWSAACSTGQEIYSIAMMLTESFPQLTGWSIKLFATDISGQIIERAIEARFHQFEVNRGLPATMLVKYFEKDGLEWRLKEPIRKMVTFQRLNLLDPWPVDLRPDVVLLRNVLIYFDVNTKKEILTRVRRILRPDGALLLGAAETTLGLDPGWERAPGTTPWYRPLQGVS